MSQSRGTARHRSTPFELHRCGRCTWEHVFRRVHSIGETRGAVADAGALLEEAIKELGAPLPGLRWRLETFIRQWNVPGIGVIGPEIEFAIELRNAAAHGFPLVPVEHGIAAVSTFFFLHEELTGHRERAQNRPFQDADRQVARDAEAVCTSICAEGRSGSIHSVASDRRAPEDLAEGAIMVCPPLPRSVLVDALRCFAELTPRAAADPGRPRRVSPQQLVRRRVSLLHFLVTRQVQCREHSRSVPANHHPLELDQTLREQVEWLFDGLMLSTHPSLGLRCDPL